MNKSRDGNYLFVQNAASTSRTYLHIYGADDYDYGM